MPKHAERGGSTPSLWRMKRALCSIVWGDVDAFAVQLTAELGVLFPCVLFPTVPLVLKWKEGCPSSSVGQ